MRQPRCPLSSVSDERTPARHGGQAARWLIPAARVGGRRAGPQSVGSHRDRRVPVWSGWPWRS